MTHVSKRSIFAVILSVAFACGLAWADELGLAVDRSDEPAPDVRLVVRVYYDDLADVQALMRYDLWEYNNLEERYVLVAVTGDELNQIEARGFRAEVDEARTTEFNAVREVPPGQDSGIPGFPCYRTVEETFDTAVQIVADHPELATWADIGDTWEKQEGLGGYDMMALRLTNSAVTGTKPKLIITASIHAREYTPAELATRFAEFLVDNYDSNADVTWLLDYHEIHIVLQANPDGRKQAETSLSWRKNTNQNYCSPTSNTRGADLNRNFSFEWGCCGGSSGFGCNLTYRGVAPASEPEVQAIQSYLLSEFPDQRPDPLIEPAQPDAMGVYIDIHSYSELVLWPWGFSYPAPNNTELRTMGRKLAYFNGYLPEPSTALYATDGTTIDFAYGEQGVAAFVFELGNNFFEGCSAFESQILPDNLAALTYAAKAARAPYMIPAGPDAIDVAFSPPVLDAGSAGTLTASIYDGRFNNSNGAESVQNIATAEYYLDVPPWNTTANPQPIAMAPTDGAFNAPSEAADAVIDTTALSAGRHIVYVRGQDADGNWGAMSAAFFYVTDGSEGMVAGTLTDASTGLPVGGTVSIDGFSLSASSDPVSGAYSLTLPGGSWSVRASSPVHLPQLAGGVSVSQGEVTFKDFSLTRAPRVLLVDDDDDTPDMLSRYATALSLNGTQFEVWDTGGSDNEPEPSDLEPYEMVVWFSGDSVGGAAGPGPLCERSLGGWLDTGRCLLISSQDYLDDRGMTSLIQGYLGVGTGTTTVQHQDVTGAGPFAGLGTYGMSYPYTNRSDAISPGPTGELAFSGSAGDAAVARDAGGYRATYWGFGLESIAGESSRAEAMGAFLGWCNALDGDGDGVIGGDDCSPVDPEVWDAPDPAQSLTVGPGPSDNLSWTAPATSGSTLVYFNVLRGEDASDFSGATCIHTGLETTTSTDGDIPASGVVYYYLIQTWNGCGATIGATSSGVPRIGLGCF